LYSLEGAPTEVGLHPYTQLPKNPGGYFDCADNKHLTSLKYGPVKVGGRYNCSGCDLTSLEGAPEEVGGDFHCGKNPGNFTEEDVRSVCKVHGKVIV